MSPAEYEEKVKSFLKTYIEIPASQIFNIELTTKGQSSNPNWIAERNFRITSCNFGKICKLRATTSCANTIKNLLYSTFTGSAATHYGNENEVIARDEFSKLTGLDVTESGLVIDKCHPFLGASPDGIIVEEDAILEIKCPFSARDFTPVEAIKQKIIKFATISESGNIELKVNDNYYYQVQGLLHVTQTKHCYFVIYTPKKIEFLKILKDDEFWFTKMEKKLKNFYYSCLLPEIIDPRHTRGQEIRNPSRD